MQKQVAQFISTIGHPLLTIPVMVISALFTVESFEKALQLSAIIAGGIFIPVIYKLYKGSRNGQYTNFDVSDRKERQAWYFYPIVLSGIVTAILFATHQSRPLCYGVAGGCVLLVLSALVNTRIKSSLHLAFNVYLAFLMLPISAVLGYGLLIFSIFLGWSRLTLQRHTMPEILVGSVLGLLVGAAYWMVR